jgi:hypothetical protein
MREETNKQVGTTHALEAFAQLSAAQMYKLLGDAHNIHDE